tara:strand:+ start:245 stop:754 length:510 start_codon:yes stop_codon:yes gene_type:complete
VTNDKFVAETEKKRGIGQVIKWRELGKKVGFTNGCFDLLHPGHIALLEGSKKHCDILVVGLNSDRSVAKLKGSARPIQDQLSRKTILTALKAISLVIIFDEETPERLIEKLKPDILVKGGDYKTEDIIGADFVRSYGGEVLTIPYLEGNSSTSIIDKVIRGRLGKIASD